MLKIPEDVARDVERIGIHRDEIRGDGIYIRSHEGVEGVTYLSDDPNFDSSPKVGIIGGMHGNEVCGVRAIERVKELAHAGELRMGGGTIALIHGNPEAARQGRRHTEGGVDLNRQFDFHFEDSIAKHRWCYEHQRALELRPIVSKLDTAIDLHSATAPTEPFAIVTKVPRSAEFARKLNLPYITHGWEGPGRLGKRILLHLFTVRDLPSLAVECGQHEDQWVHDRAIETALHFLAACGVIDESCSPKRSPLPALELNIVDAVKKPSTGFAFHGRFIGLQQVAPGFLVGSDDNLEIRSKRKAFIIMPNASVRVGEDMLYLAQQIDPSTHVPEDDEEPEPVT